MIAEAAYFRAEHRGFDDSDPATDWIEAEREVDAKLDAANELQGLLQERLAIANEWLKGIRKKLSDLPSETREAWYSDVEKLTKLRDRFRKQVKEIQGKSGRAAAHAKDQAETIWSEITSTLDRLSKRRIRH
jgi:hypothetical protein